MVYEPLTASYVRGFTIKVEHLEYPKLATTTADEISFLLVRITNDGTNAFYPLKKDTNVVIMLSLPAVRAIAVKVRDTEFLSISPEDEVVSLIIKETLDKRHFQGVVLNVHTRNQGHFASVLIDPIVS